MRIAGVRRLLRGRGIPPRPSRWQQAPGACKVGTRDAAPGSFAGPDSPGVFRYCLVAPMLSRISRGILPTIVYAGS